MGNTFNESFSCPIKKAVKIQQAKDRAKEYGKKWSEYVVELIEADNKKHSQEDTKQQNSGIISILNKGELVCITEFIPRLYENLKERQQQLRWIQNVDNEELINFTRRNKDTANMIKLRRDNENRESRERTKLRSLNTVMPNSDEIIGKDNSMEVPDVLDDIRLAEDNL